MDKKIRTFIAMELNPNLKNIITKIQDNLKTFNFKAGWVKPENIHLTLKFLGYIETEKIQTIYELLTPIINDFNVLFFKLTEINAFPSINRPRIIWIGVDKEYEIRKLAGLIEDRLSHLGFEKEEKEFHPHLTIGRLKFAQRTSELKIAIEKTGRIINETYKYDHITIFKSLLSSKGPTYIPLHKIKLKDT